MIITIASWVIVLGAIATVICASFGIWAAMEWWDAEQKMKRYSIYNPRWAELSRHGHFRKEAAIAWLQIAAGCVAIVIGAVVITYLNVDLARLVIVIVLIIGVAKWKGIGE